MRRIPPDRRLFFALRGEDADARASARRLLRDLAARAGGTQRDVLFPKFFPPSIIGVAPNNGSGGGGTNVTISGANFLQGATVLFDGLAGTGVVVTPTAIVVNTPAHAPATVDVVVVNPDGQFATSLGGYTYNNPSFLSVGRQIGAPFNGIAQTSPDGTNWFEHAMPVTGSPYNALARRGSRIVAVGSSIAAYSDDGGFTWNPGINVPAAGFFAIADSGTLFVALGDNTKLMTSPDGITWTAGAVPSTGGQVKAVAYSPALGRFVAVAGGTSDYLTSTTGLNGSWGHPVNRGGVVSAFAAIWDGTAFILVGNVGTTGERSTTGIDNWNPIAIPIPGGTILQALAQSDTQLVTVGQGGATAPCATSPDGTTWTSQSTPINTNRMSVAWNGVVFCSGGTDRNVITSPTGVLWTSRQAQNHSSAAMIAVP